MKEGFIPNENGDIRPIEERSQLVKEVSAQDIAQVITWIREVGLREGGIDRSILANREDLLIDRLDRFAAGEPTDFLIWNCIKFNWTEKPDRSYPSCRLGDNLDNSRTLFYKSRIQEIAEKLSIIGNPNITILVPTNEAFDSRTWEYEQTIEEREDVIEKSVKGLRDGLSDIVLPDNASLIISRWDEFLQERGASRNAESYSVEGAERIRQRPDFNRKLRDLVDDGYKYFWNKRIRVDVESIKQQRILYYGIYAGEGVAFEELKAKGRNIVVINFEEMRPPTYAYRGSKDDLCVITPIRQINKRISNNE